MVFYYYILLSFLPHPSVELLPLSAALIINSPGITIEKDYLSILLTMYN